MAQSFISPGVTIVVLFPSDLDEDAALADAELETVIGVEGAVIGVEGAPLELGVGGMKLPCGDEAAGPADPLAIEELCAAAACCGGSGPNMSTSSSEAGVGGSALRRCRWRPSHAGCDSG